MNINVYTALADAESDMSTQIGKFSSTFAKVEDQSTADKIILGCIGLVFALAASPAWNSCKKKKPQVLLDAGD